MVCRRAGLQGRERQFTAGLPQCGVNPKRAHYRRRRTTIPAASRPTPGRRAIRCTGCSGRWSSPSADGGDPVDQRAYRQGHRARASPRILREHYPQWCSVGSLVASCSSPTSSTRRRPRADGRSRCSCWSAAPPACYRSSSACVCCVSRSSFTTAAMPASSNGLTLSALRLCRRSAGRYTAGPGLRFAWSSLTRMDQAANDHHWSRSSARRSAPISSSGRSRAGSRGIGIRRDAKPL